MIVMLNGSSGSGKTTIADRLNRQYGVNWLHPDGLWSADTPQRESVFRAVGMAVENYSATELVIIDHQFRINFFNEAMAYYEVQEGESALLHCDSTIRCRRLLDRGWGLNEIEKMDRWAEFLLREAREHEISVIDTGVNKPSKSIEMLRRAIPVLDAAIEDGYG